MLSLEVQVGEPVESVEPGVVTGGVEAIGVAVGAGAEVLVDAGARVLLSENAEASFAKSVKAVKRNAK